jgi:hypothetical protein
LDHRAELDGGAIARRQKVGAGLSEFATYIKNHRDFIPHLGERWRQGESLRTGLVESRGQPTIRQEAANAVDTPRNPSAMANQDEASQRGTRRRVPAVVSTIQAEPQAQNSERKAAPDFLTVSPL